MGKVSLWLHNGAFDRVGLIGGIAFGLLVEMRGEVDSSQGIRRQI